MKYCARKISVRLCHLMLIAGLALLALILLLSKDAEGQYAYEKEYQDRWCTYYGGVTEFVLEDKTRVDCLTEKYAIEVDWANHWNQSIGQALFYASRTKTRAGILLIMRSSKDCKYLGRLREAISFGRIGITVWQTGDYAYLCGARTANRKSTWLLISKTATS